MIFSIPKLSTHVIDIEHLLYRSSGRYWNQGSSLQQWLRRYTGCIYCVSLPASAAKNRTFRFIFMGSWKKVKKQWSFYEGFKGVLEKYHWGDRKMIKAALTDEILKYIAKIDKTDTRFYLWYYRGLQRADCKRIQRSVRMHQIRWKKAAWLKTAGRLFDSNCYIIPYAPDESSVRTDASREILYLRNSSSMHMNTA